MWVTFMLNEAGTLRARPARRQEIARAGRIHTIARGQNRAANPPDSKENNMRQEIAEVTALRDVAEGIFELELHAPGICSEMILPGQFVQVSLNDASRLLARPISVRDVIGENLVLAIQQKGEGTRQLSRLSVGDRLRLTGCMGNGFDWDDDGEYLLVGGGIGMAPILFLESRMRAPHKLLAGFRSARYAFGVELPGAIVATEDGSLGEKGFVTDALRREIEREAPDCVMCCGPTPMLRAVQQVCAEMGVRCQLSLEERMGCGLGACLVCNCKIRASENGEWNYKRVCVDGPVFYGSEVVFDG